MQTLSPRRLARTLYTYSLSVTGFCLLVEVASILGRDGKPISSINKVGILSAIILVISIIALHLLARREDAAEPFEN
jgi:hypothetical protein